MWGLLSIQKLLLLVVIIGGVFAFYRFMDRRKQTSNPSDATQQKPKSDANALDMTSCSTCGAWVSAACERPDCPIE
ncbi:MAG: hypothetical protein ISQ21_08110 [Alphaproteobacteria bacterium]|nr:hypothetical protein [Alphaproteobacteria bacterium]